jgi:aspartate/methionine/tyrosine aminotransferase
VLVNSFSKYFSMTGWRLGWMVLPQHLRDAVERLQQNIYICAPHVSQVAGLGRLRCHGRARWPCAALRQQPPVAHRRSCRRRHHSGAAADGAFYVYADVTELATEAGDSMALCYQWLDELGVAATPGLDFDLARGHRFVRFSYAGAAADIAEACDRLAQWVR